MSREPSIDKTSSDQELVGRRLFLQSMGKWSGAAIAAAVFGSTWVASPPKAEAGAVGQPPGRLRWRVDQRPGRMVAGGGLMATAVVAVPGLTDGTMVAEVHGSIAGE